MSDIIPELTQDMLDAIPRYYEKWRQVALSTQPVDRSEVESLVPELYRAYNRPPPKRLIWHASPQDFITQDLGRYPGYSNGILSSIFITLNQCEYYKPGGLFENSPTYRRLQRIYNFAGNLFRLWDDGKAGTLNSLFRVDFCDYYRLFCVDCIRNLFGLTELTRRAAPLLRMAERVIFLPYEDFCLLVENPVRLQVDVRDRLHSDQGPAIIYADGHKRYAYHGVLVEEKLIEERDKLTLREVEAEPNLERHRILVELYGYDRYLRDSKAELIAKDDHGELYSLHMLYEPLVMVKVINSTPEPDGTSKEYWLRVNPELRPLLPDGELGSSQKLTPRNAIASTFGLYGYEYGPGKQT